MSEVISSDDSPTNRSWPDPYADDGSNDEYLDDEAAPTPVRTGLVDPGALAIGALPLALLSLVGSQLLIYLISLLSYNGVGSFDSPADQSRWMAASGALFALVAGGIGLAALRRAAREDDTPRWVRALAGGAVIIAIVGLAVSVLVAVVATVTGNSPNDNFGT